MSAPSHPVVCLLRTLDVDDLYERALTEEGFRVVSQPVLRFAPVNQQVWRTLWQQPAAYAGLILTSPRAVQVLVDSMAENPAIGQAWRGKPTWAVGPKTAALLGAAGFTPEGEEAGSGQVLAELIKKQRWEKPLLFPCGNRRREELPDALRAAQVPFEACVVYETRLRTHLDFSSLPLPDWLVFFSPSGVEAVQQAQGVDHTAVRHAALGPATAAALELAGWSPDAVAEAPTPKALVAALQEAVR